MHVVLPEGTEDRLLRAADTLLRREVVDVTLLGDPAVVRARATQLRRDISGAAVIDPDTDALRERFAEEYAARRAHKGVTVDAAGDVVADVCYFGTLMVLLGLADGMGKARAALDCIPVIGAILVLGLHAAPELQRSSSRRPVREHGGVQPALDQLRATSLRRRSGPTVGAPTIAALAKRASQE